MTKGSAAAKRGFDLVVALIGLIIQAPLFIVIAILIKLDTRGPVFFRQERAGMNGSTFRIFKFRSMIVGAYRSGARLTVKRDPRITKVGQILRWTKLDELPQVINVLTGDMSFVGPRPEDPYFTNFYDSEQRQVLSIRPGIIGPSQLHGRDEVEEYPEDVENVEQYYIEKILPDKLERDLEYVRSASFFGDLKYLVGGFFKVLSSQVKGGFLARSKYRLAFLCGDIVLMAAAYMLANFIKFDWGMDLEPEQWAFIGQGLLLAIVLKPPVFVYYGLYQRETRWVGSRDVAAIIKAASVGSAFLVGAAYFTGLRAHSRAVFIYDWALLVALLCIARYGVRAFLNRQSKDAEGEGASFVKVLVAGAGHGGETILRSLLEDPHSRFMPVGIIDHEPHRWGALVHGIRVMGGATDIAMAASTHGVEMVLVSLADLDPVVVREITDACDKHDLEYRLIPALSDLLAEGAPRPIKRVALSPQGRI